jgi:hypothetical protein
MSGETVQECWQGDGAKVPRAVKPAGSGYPQGDPGKDMDADPPEKSKGIIIS